MQLVIFTQKNKANEITLKIDQYIIMLQNAKTIKMTATLRAHQFAIIALG